MKIGGSGLFLLKNGQEWIAFVENGSELVVFLEKRVGVGESDWEWLGVTGIGWDRNSVKPVSLDYGKCIAIVC